GVEARGRDLARDGRPSSSIWLMVRLSRAVSDRDDDVSAMAGLAYLAVPDRAGSYCPPGTDGKRMVTVRPGRTGAAGARWPRLRPVRPPRACRECWSRAR